MRIPQNIEPKTNNFDFLRLFAALLVVFGHSLLVTNSTSFINWGNGSFISDTGLNIFFIISGFLITQSWLSSHNFFVFFKKRFLRIYPAFLTTILFTVFLLGPLTTFFSISHYFSDPQTFNYLKNIFLFTLLPPTSNVLPGVFVNNHFPLIVNGSLWTIPIEIGFYIFIAILGVFSLFKRKKLMVVLFATFFISNVVFLTNRELGASLSFPYLDLIRLGAYFFAGVALYLYKDTLVMTNKLILVLFLLYLTLIGGAYFSIASFLLLPLFVISFAFAKIDFPKKFTAYGDFSYGIYLFAFPVQQTLAHFSQGKFPLLIHFLLSVSISLLLAIFSWNFIEKPCLKLKK